VSTDGYAGPQSGRDVGRYFGGISLREVGHHHVEGTADAADHLRAPDGGVRFGALLTILDSVGGLCTGLSALPDGWVVSTNLTGRTITRRHVGPFHIDAKVLRSGKNAAIAKVRIFDQGADDTLVMDGVLTSAILVPENGPPQWTRPLTIERQDAFVDPLPMDEFLAVRTVDDGVEIELAEGLRNPWGFLHGGVVAALADTAAVHAVGGVTTDLVLHFLSPNRVGPVRAIPRRIGSRSDGEVVRVELQDVGADRITAVAIATVSSV